MDSLMMRRRAILGAQGNVSTLRYTTTADMPAGDYVWAVAVYARDAHVVLDGNILSRTNNFRASVGAGVHKCIISLPGKTVLPDYYFNRNFAVAGGYIDELHIEGSWTGLGKSSILANAVRSLWLADSIETMGRDAIGQNANLTSINGVSDGGVLTIPNLREWVDGNFAPSALIRGKYAGGLRFPNLRSWGGTSGINSTGLSSCRPSGGFDIELGEKFTTIYGGAVDRCWIKDLIVRATTPPEFISNSGHGGTVIFFQSNLYGNIKVPAASVDAYKAAPGWSDLSNYIIAI